MNPTAASYQREQADREQLGGRSRPGDDKILVSLDVFQMVQYSQYSALLLGSGPMGPGLQ